MDDDTDYSNSFGGVMEGGCHPGYIQCVMCGSFTSPDIVNPGCEENYQCMGCRAAEPGDTGE